MCHHELKPCMQRLVDNTLSMIVAIVSHLDILPSHRLLYEDVILPAFFTFK